MRLTLWQRVLKTHARMTNRDGYILHGPAFLGSHTGWADESIIIQSCFEDPIASRFPSFSPVPATKTGL